MQLCSRGHEEVCYDDDIGECPVCLMEDNKDSEIEDLTNEIKDLKEALATAERERDDALAQADE